MIDLTPLLPPALANSVEPPPAEPLDASQLDEIVSLSDHNELLAAAEQAQAAWVAGHRDVRILGFYLCGAFLQGGLGALLPIGRAITTQLKDAWPTLSPVQNKERHADAALRWLFSSILAQLRFAQRTQKEPWQETLMAWAAQPQAQVLAQLESAAASMADVLGSGAKTAAFAIVAWLRTLPPTAENKSTPAPAAHDPAADALATTPPAGPGGEGNPPLPVPGRSPSESASPTLTLPLSPPMQKLLRKLDAFGRLVAMGKFRHAAIVYKDIQGSLSSFDPRQYFPLLFGDYYGHVVTNADKLTKHLGEDKGFLADALKELYQTDLERFVASKG
ncbi:MAG TPA: type VI secretion system protein IglI family protein [Pseudomonadota bacterium]|nr:type VI secretion system protein IglI family protein [Pseudomonadota bacterium]